LRHFGKEERRGIKKRKVKKRILMVGQLSNSKSSPTLTPIHTCPLDAPPKDKNAKALFLFLFFEFFYFFLKIFIL
jgi:hypothetical protein